MRTLLVTVALGAVLAGCTGMFRQTPYAEAVQVARLGGTMLRVTGKVNDETSDARLQDYLLLRAAEETLAAGYGHFRVLGHEATSITSTPGFMARWHNDKFVIVMYKGPKPPDATGSVYDAAEVVSFVGPRMRAR